MERLAARVDEAIASSLKGVDLVRHAMDGNDPFEILFLDVKQRENLEVRTPTRSA